MSGQTGRIVGTIAGAALAYFTGGASYVALGATLGGVVGSMLDPKAKIEGPRLDDLKVQFSSYGVGIPRLYGTERVGGNVIWSTDKLEIASVTSSGKGGGGTENTSYKYYVHMSMLLCETPRDGSTVSIVKFFQDGKLIWDASSGIPIASALASAENPYSAFELFQGHQDQLPDPIEESWTGGPGSCSAYRGVVRIRMIAIECPGGRVPQFSFVLSTGATVVVEKTEFGTVPKVSGENAIALVGLGQTLHISELAPAGGPYTLTRTLIGNGYTTPMGDINLVTRGGGCFPVNGTEYGSGFVVRDAGNYVGAISNYYSSPKWLELIDVQTGGKTRLLDYVGTDSTNCFIGGMVACYDPTTGLYAAAQAYPVGTNVYAANPVIIDNNSALPVGTAIPGGTVLSLAMYGGVLAILNERSGNYYVRRYDAATGVFLDELVGPSSAGLSASEKIRSALRFDVNGLFAWVGTIAGAAVYRVNTAWSLLCNDADNLLSAKDGGGTTFYADANVCIIGPSQASTRAYDLIRFAVPQTNPYKVKNIITAECALAGDGVYDVSGIPDSDTVIGYKLANPASARANIEPLLTLIGGYVVDEDGATKFKKFSDITSVADVSFDELGQAEGDASGEAMPLTRTQEIDLPRSVTTSYINPTSDYQTAAETEIRQVTDATEDAQIQLPICVTSDQARKVSQMVLYDRWRRQNTRTTSVSRKFAAVSPGDGVTIEYPRGTWKLWLVLSTNDTGAVCEWSLCPGDAAIFTQTAVGATGYVSQQVSALPAPLQAVILDIPLLRDIDNSAGPYVALDSYADVPADGELLVGDDDTNLAPRGTVSASAPIGFAETALAGWTGALVDETNTFTVALGDDVFSSVTRDVLLAGGAEYWAYGAPGRWEIGASAQGDSLGDGRYILSRHLRGLFGTERFTGTHVAGDTLVLLRIAGLLRPDTGVGGIGQTKSYRAITKGRSTDSAPSQTYANTGEGLTPLSPINLRRTDTNDYTVDRRSRLAMNNLTGVLPIGEATEAYSWAFYDSSFTNLIGTVLTNVPTVTAAQQTAIGITPSAVSYLKVRQVSDSVGPGHELQATL
jgi:hypothetical protein